MSYLIMVPVATNEVGSTVVVLDYLGSHRRLPGLHPGHHGHQDQHCLVERNITIKNACRRP